MDAGRAGVQAPTIYHLFGDKDGLLEAVTEHVMAAFVADKAADAAAATAADTDPLDDLRASWRRQMGFSPANPAVFRLLSDPDRAPGSPAARMGRQVLRTRVHRLAAAGPTGDARVPGMTGRPSGVAVDGRKGRRTLPPRLVPPVCFVAFTFPAESICGVASESIWSL